MSNNNKDTYKKTYIKGSTKLPKPTEKVNEKPIPKKTKDKVNKGD